ncbi:RNase P and RNase MRP subunit, partial [Kickxella alabastrina]
MAAVANSGHTARKIGDQRRPMLKHALDKPFTTPWPTATPALQCEIVDALCAALQPVGAYFAESRRISKQKSLHKRRAAQKAAKAAKAANKTKSQNNKDEKKGRQAAPAQTADTTTSAAAGVRQQIADSMETDSTEAAKAGLALLDYIVIGINSTTRSLEKQARQSNNKADLALVVVCKGDVEPQMIAHLPALVHAAQAASSNSAEHSDGPGLRLVAVDKGSEQRLAAAVGQQRVTVLGIRSGSPQLDSILEKARAGILAPVVPWIGAGISVGGSTSSSSAYLAKPGLKAMAALELQTTAPILNKQQNAKAKAKANPAAEAANAGKDCSENAPATAGPKKRKQNL